MRYIPTVDGLSREDHERAARWEQCRADFFGQNSWIEKAEEAANKSVWHFETAAKLQLEEIAIAEAEAAVEALAAA